MPSLFRRRTDDTPDTKTGDTVTVDGGSTGTAEPDTEGSDEASAADARPKSYTAGKGRPTPKRRDARRRTAEPPPANRKEAARRLRERQRKERMEARQRMMAGDPKYLPARDRGEERATVRNIVDARRNIGSYFLIAALIILIGTSSGMPPIIRMAAQFLWYALALAFIVDCVVLCRRTRKVVHARFPKTTQRYGSLYMYAVMRSITFRRMRMPSPQVKLGDKVS